MTEQLAKAMVWLDLLQLHGRMGRLVERHPMYTEAYRLALIEAEREVADLRKAEEEVTAGERMAP